MTCRVFCGFFCLKYKSFTAPPAWRWFLSLSSSHAGRMQNMAAPHERGRFFDRPWVVRKQKLFPRVNRRNTGGTPTWVLWDRWVRSDVTRLELRQKEMEADIHLQNFYASSWKTHKIYPSFFFLIADSADLTPAAGTSTWQIQIYVSRTSVWDGVETEVKVSSSVKQSKCIMAGKWALRSQALQTVHGHQRQRNKSLRLFFWGVGA